MVSIDISEFHANMRAILQRAQNGEIISLLLRETEAAKLVPSDYARIAAHQKLEELRQTAVIGDLLSPIDESWDIDLR